MINLQSPRGLLASPIRKSGLRSAALFITACAGVLAGLCSQHGQAVMFTFDLRVTGVTGAGSFTTKSVDGSSVGTVVTVELYGIVNGLDNTQTNDAILSGGGSFLSLNSVGGGTGTWLAFDGTATYGTAGAGTVNNTDAAPNFQGPLSQNGGLAATDSTGGGFDLGRDNAAVESATPNPNPYFKYVSKNTPTAISGTQAVSGPVEFLLGTKTFRIDSQVTSPLTLQFAGRNTTNLSKEIKFTIDGVAKSLNGTDANIGYGPAVTITVPEPSAFGMLALGALGLIGFRRVGFRRTV